MNLKDTIYFNIIDGSPYIRLNGRHIDDIDLSNEQLTDFYNDDGLVLENVDRLLVDSDTMKNVEVFHIEDGVVVVDKYMETSDSIIVKFEELNQELALLKQEDLNNKEAIAELYMMMPELGGM